MDEKHKSALIFLFLLFLGGAIALITYGVASYKSHEESFLIEHLTNSDSPDDSSVSPNVSTYVSKSIKNAIKTINKITGPPGEKGDAGIPGANGGTFISKGSLRNLGLPNNSNKVFLERTYANNEVAGVILKEQTHMPQQTWTYRSDNKIANDYGTPEYCMYVDSNKLNLLPCDRVTKGGNWSYNKQSSAYYITDENGNKKCLDTDGNNITINNCDASIPTQQWSFY